MAGAHPMALRAYAAARAAAFRAANLLRGARQWSEVVTRFTARGRVHQVNSVTWHDRYPDLFGAARALLGDRPAARLLSFGCSSGEEVMTLRQYFPTAEIVGAEINRYLLRACGGLPVDGGIEFVASSEDALRARGPFDAIFCMAVLTRRPHEIERRRLSDISSIYRFESFAREIEFLASLLAPGGLLVVEHSLYRVEDAIKGLELVPVASHGLGPSEGSRFAPSGALIVPQPVVARFFRKPAASPKAPPGNPAGPGDPTAGS